MRKRTLAREFVLKILYQAELTRRDIPQTAETFYAEKEECDDVVRDFSNFLTQGVFEKITDIDNVIIKYAANWQIDRMAVIDRNILRLGVFEILFASDIPPKVTINEAVELAKKYGDAESGKFVNGILDKIHKEELPDTEQKDTKVS